MDARTLADQALPMARVANCIEIVEPAAEDCLASLPPEGNVKLRNYRLLSENLRAYTPTGDIHTSPTKGKLVSKFDVWGSLSPPRARILELVRPTDPGRAALEAIVRPAPRRGLARPLDEDARRFLQRALLSPSPQNSSNGATPEPQVHTQLSSERERTERTEAQNDNVDEDCRQANNQNSKERSLADELREAEEEERSGGSIRRDLLREFRRRGGGIREAFERERLGKLALSVEDDEGEECGGLSAAARRLDALLAESRELHDELANIHEDIQVLARRVARRD
ncbi:uncharacterized protein LOC126370704 isoform X2 [Pectinophora gossypiella]|uniref:uncharacterized protein LOC126370704 isoform X2 n=1 Tax=Pectinophora gossypiella TaxID=13191 RepID=UPI00214F0256|nr:uncharacterized protein LOC126370704 isoform X2 [Pectinophora gossypiella]